MPRPWSLTSACLASAGALAVAACSVFGPSLDPLTEGARANGEAVLPSCPDGSAACSGGCPADQTTCGGACVDLRREAGHCGACGRACASGQECVEGACVVACSERLQAPVADAWGTRWDGSLRVAATVSAAQQACAAFRGRLPTASEIHRTRAGEPGAIGALTDVDRLWTLVPSGRDPAPSHVAARLSDGATSSSLDADALAYRCVCPAPAPGVFAGGQCFGPLGSACVPLQGVPGAPPSALQRYNLDARDRPRANKASAVFECAFAGGHLATPIQLAEAIVERWELSAPGTTLFGSGPGLMAADEVDRNASAVVRFKTGEPFAFQSDAPNGLEAVGTREVLPFRCVGPTTPAVHPAAIPGEWTSPTRRKFDATDQVPATAIEAIQRCFDRGGHLPTSAELAEGILTGLPGGTLRYQWTSDQTGSDGQDPTLAVHRWSDVETSYSYGVDDRSWSAKTEVRPYRCVFYPVDVTYAGPTVCGSQIPCTVITLPGQSGARMWFDTVDRLPAEKPLHAIQGCLMGGGHLPSERDLTEAIRAGLPNGTGSGLLAGDVMRGTQIPLSIGLVSWNGTSRGFDDIFGAGSSSNPTSRTYRCMWTNELR